MTDEDLTPGQRQLREESAFLDSLPDGGPAEWSIEQIKRWVECRVVCHHEYGRAAMRKLIAEIDKAGRVLHSMITGGEWDPEVRFQAGRAAEKADVIAYARELNYGPTLRRFIKHVARDEHHGKAGNS